MLTGLGDAWPELEEERKRTQMFWQDVERKNPAIATWRNLTIAGVMSDDIARDSYFKMLGAGFTKIEFLEMLVGLAVLGTKKIPKLRPFPDCGMNRGQIGRFPKRLRDIAEEIERLNKHPLIRPDIFVVYMTASEPLKKHLGKWFLQLPILLRSYAAFFAVHAKSTAWFMKRNVANHRTWRPEVLCCLVDLVRKETGRPRLTDLANILTATAHEAGISEVGLDADSLKTLEAKHRKKGMLSPA